MIMIYGCKRKDSRRTQECAGSATGFGLSDSLRQPDCLRSHWPDRETQRLCVPASQQVCLYRCNRSKKSNLPDEIL